jgi:hypothetical protein
VHDLGAARAARAARPTAEGRRRTALAPWLAAAAALLLAVGAGTRWQAERTARGDAERLLAERTATLGARERRAGRARLAARRAARPRRADGAAHRHRRRARRCACTGSGRAAWWCSRRRRSPRCAPGRTYQLWGIPTGGPPQGLGTFAPAANGEARVVLRVPPGAAMDVAAITEEPDGGSPAPTTTPIVLGQFRGD